MKPRLSTTLALLLCAVVLLAGAHTALAATAQRAASQKETPGVALAQTVSLVTGVAISPLLGVGAVGAYYWWKAPEEKRAGLPWYAQPWFWIPALLLVTLIGVKDILGAAAPTALKKPFDVAETMEHKISGLIAAGAFLPLIISVFPEAAGSEARLMEMSPLSAAGFAAIDIGAVGNALLIPFALAIFAVVWLASNAINILILLSPFTTLDTLLKGFRMSILAVVGSTALLNPWLGAAVALMVITVAYFTAGWSFRLTVLGTVYLWDFLTLRHQRFQPGTESNKMFTSREIQGVPPRTYGRLVRQSQGSMAFEYRPWLILPKERFAVHPGEYIVGRCIACPEIARVEGERLTSMFVMSPRYSGHEEAVARSYGLAGVRDVGIRKGLKAGWNWLRGLFKGSGSTSPAAAICSETAVPGGELRQDTLI